jgi:hypothetical protein
LETLLAPKALKFYMSDWDELAPGGNNKEDLKVLEFVEYATGISPEALTAFEPGVQNAREVMKWVSGRKTTMPEDMAYCLIGIFDLKMSPAYGEGGERAFERLQEEIIKITHNKEMFKWRGGRTAPHPRCFLEF